jgi:hypothetical protein
MFRPIRMAIFRLLREVSYNTVKLYYNYITFHTRSRGSQILKQPAHEDGKVVSPTHRPPLPHEIFLVLISVKGLSHPQSHSAAGRIMSMKTFSDIIGNRTRDLPVCSAVPQPLRHRVPPKHYARSV